MRPRIASLLAKTLPVLSTVASHHFAHPGSEFATAIMGGYVGSFTTYLTTKIQISNAQFSTHKALLKLCVKDNRFDCTLIDNKVIFSSKETGKQLGWIKTSPDPMVVEVTTNPFYLDELDSHMGEILNDGVYGLKRVGLKAGVVGGEGHVHIDFDSLFRTVDTGSVDYRFFRNYVVDWANHNELYYGAFHYDPKKFGATPLLRTKDERKAFQKWLDSYDTALNSNSMDESQFLKYLSELQDKVGFKKGAALNIRPRGLKTIEIRSLRNRSSVEELSRVLNILQSRANYLYNQAGLIKYYNAGAVRTPKDVVNRFSRYIKETGLSWNEYKLVMPKLYQKIEPSDLPDEVLFAPGANEPSTCYRAFTRLLIHVFNN